MADRKITEYNDGSGQSLDYLVGLLNGEFKNITRANVKKMIFSALTEALSDIGENATRLIGVNSSNNAGFVTNANLLKTIGGCNFFGTCSTEAPTAAKVATISNFLLLKNAIVAIRFTRAISVASATLNVSGTGAKPIVINGTALQPGVVRPGMTLLLLYDGTNWDVVAMLGQEQSAAPSDLVVDMGLPSGLLWAKKNIDITQANGFAASEFQYECTFFSWGNTDGHNPTSASSFGSYSWGGGNDQEPYVSSPGAKLTGHMSPSFDFARANLGAPWRLPTTEEYAELFANIEYLDASGNVIDTATADKRCTLNGITGLHIRSKLNGNTLFFPCSGYGDGSSWNGRGGYGLYWSSSLYSATHGRYLHFGSGGVSPQNSSNRFHGFAGRAVQ